jgi:hypothetical protein
MNGATDEAANAARLRHSKRLVPLQSTCVVPSSDVSEANLRHVVNT